MPNMKRMMRVWLGVFDHDPLIFWRAPPKVRAGGEHLIHYSARIFGCCEYRLRYPFTASMRLIPGTLPISALTCSAISWARCGTGIFFPFDPAARFIGRGLKEGSGNAPFAREGDGLPFQFGERNIIRRAIGFDFFFDELLFLLKHKC